MKFSVVGDPPVGVVVADWRTPVAVVGRCGHVCRAVGVAGELLSTAIGCGHGVAAANGFGGAFAVLVVGVVGCCARLG